MAISLLSFTVKPFIISLSAVIESALIAPPLIETIFSPPAPLTPQSSIVDTEVLISFKTSSTSLFFIAPPKMFILPLIVRSSLSASYFKPPPFPIEIPPQLDPTKKFPFTSNLNLGSFL